MFYITISFGNVLVFAVFHFRLGQIFPALIHGTETYMCAMKCVSQLLEEEGYVMF